MNMIQKLFSILIIGAITTSVHAQTTPLITNQSLNGINKETLFLIKRELELSKKVLIEIRDNANPGVISSATSTLGTVIKELIYIIAATDRVGGGI